MYSYSGGQMILSGGKEYGLFLIGSFFFYIDLMCQKYVILSIENSS